MTDHTSGRMARLFRPLRAAGVAALTLVMGGCSAVGMFNAVVPKDGNTEVVRDIAYGEAQRQTLDIYRPAATGQAPLPVVFFAYGGGWSDGSKAEYAFVGHALAARGFLTVIADYGLVPDYRYPAFLDDTRLALEWVGRNVADHGGDPGRVLLAGHSAGAYNVAMIALADQFAPEPDAGVRLIGVAGLSGPYDFYPFDVDASRDAFGHAPEPLETQPISHVSENAPPFLLIHGGGDKTVMPRNSIRLAELLTEAGVHAELEIYDSVDHAGPLVAISRPLRWQNPTLERMVDFFNARLFAQL
ncbi:alpha/beta hydrolase [Pelagibacterium montanilacus]|uniref:alpha/beta hydrolase n=1 Tax=Pelagibacterium montanilacus TaxID=2185280 RepID=UPI0019D151B7|nr:alpha/beta hydrolase [Pelagibacterium montanilacus]